MNRVKGKISRAKKDIFSLLIKRLLLTSLLRPFGQAQTLTIYIKYKEIRIKQTQRVISFVVCMPYFFEHIEHKFMPARPNAYPVTSRHYHPKRLIKT